MKTSILCISLFLNGLLAGWAFGHLGQCCDCDGGCCGDKCCHEEDLSTLNGWVPE